MASHFCASIIWGLVNGQVYFLIIPYMWNGQKQIKFPGGTNGGHPRATPEETRDRELREEAGLWAPEWEEVHRFTLPRQSPDEEDHTKYFFLMGPKGYDGEIRTTDLKEPDNVILKPPIWVEASELADSIFSGHRDAFQKAIRRLASMDSRLALALQELLG